MKKASDKGSLFRLRVNLINFYGSDKSSRNIKV